jgi:hypothetical protein
MIAPYKSSLDDFRLAYKPAIPKYGLDHEFLYPSNVVDLVTAGWVSTRSLTNDSAIEQAAMDYVNNMSQVSFDYILLDEVDFMWLQAGISWVGKRNFQAKDAKIWEYILKALASKFTLIGQTSTRIPTLGILQTCGQVQTGAHTTVRFDSITPILVSESVNHEQLFKIAIDNSLKENDQLPTLVYKNKYTEFDLKYMAEMVENQKRVLVVMREENCPRVLMPNGLYNYVLNLVGAVEANASGITLEGSCLHYKIIGKNTALDQITPSPDPYLFFDYIFINTSSSRQVSLYAVRGDKKLKARVITIGKELNSTIHQVAGRFRENRVEITHYLKSYKQREIDKFSGLNLWTKLFRIDFTLESYMKHGGVSSPYCSMSGQAKTMQQRMKAKWIGKPAKRKASKKQKSKLNTYNAWLSSVSNWNQTQDMLFAGYEIYCKGVGEDSYSENYVKAKLTAAKRKQHKIPI